MQVDPEDFRRRFEDLSDDALLAVNRGELVSVAQHLLDAELEKRGLAAVAPGAETAGEAVAEASPNPTEELAVADEFTSDQELAFARSLLRSADIPCYTDADFAVGAMGSTGGLRLLVPASLLEQAQEILDAPLSEEELDAQAAAAGLEEEDDEPEPDSEEDLPA